MLSIKIEAMTHNIILACKGLSASIRSSRAGQDCERECYKADWLKVPLQTLWGQSACGFAVQ